MGLEAKKQQIPLFGRPSRIQIKTLTHISTSTSMMVRIPSQRSPIKFPTWYLSRIEGIYGYFQLTKRFQGEYLELASLMDQRSDRKGSTRPISKYDSWPTIHSKHELSGKAAWGPT
jgi:hypothetical protein